jgi:hypothetical protein
MLANIICWVIAMALIFAKTSGIDLYIRLLFAMGFIFLGTLSKAVDTYWETRMSKGDEKKTSVDAG